GGASEGGWSMIRVSRRVGTALVLTAALTGVPALAGQGRPTEEPSHRQSVTQEIRASLLSAWRHLASLWAAIGSGLDPFGNPLPTDTSSGTSPTAGPIGDNGSGLDPFG